MTSPSSEGATLSALDLTEDRLAAELDLLCGRFGLHDAAVIVLDGERTVGATYLDRPGGHASVPLDAPIECSCMVKLLVAEMAARAIDDGAVALDDALVRVMRCEPGPASGVEGVSIRHLLSHTHGLDGRSLGVETRGRDGRVDISAIFGVLERRPRLARPGEYFSYGDAGYLLVGAVLEQLEDSDFGSLLRERYLHPSGVDVARTASAQGAVCPASGAGLALSAQDWAAVLRRHLAGSDPAALLLQSDSRRFPGWSLVGWGATLGWRVYGDGWLGLSGNTLDGQSTTIRICPKERRGLICVARNTGVYILAEDLMHSLCGKPRRTYEQPVLLTEEQAATVDMAALVGDFQDSDHFIAVRLTGGHLVMAVYDRGGSERFADYRFLGKRRLRLASDNICFTWPERGLPYSFVQYLRAPDRASSEHLWNGEWIWRRVA